MPESPAQTALLAVELALLFSGGGLLLWMLTAPHRRQRWLGTNALPRWPVVFPEFLLLALLVLVGGFFGQMALHLAFGPFIAKAADKAGLEIFVYGAGLHLGILAGWLLFPRLRTSLYANYGADPLPPVRSGPALSSADILRFAAGTLLVALPILTLLSLGWTELLRACGLPDEPQDLIAKFAETNSVVVLAGMLLVACGLAPLSEELFFRAGLYRFTRQKLGRLPALLINAVCFGALHGNWAGFLPLAVLGVILALAYEATGSIVVVIVAHSLFNLNTILIVLSGLPQASP